MKEIRYCKHYVLEDEPDDLYGAAPQREICNLTRSDCVAVCERFDFDFNKYYSVHPEHCNIADIRGCQMASHRGITCSTCVNFKYCCNELGVIL